MKKKNLSKTLFKYHKPLAVPKLNCGTSCFSALILSLLAPRLFPSSSNPHPDVEKSPVSDLKHLYPPLGSCFSFNLLSFKSPRKAAILRILLKMKGKKIHFEGAVHSFRGKKTFDAIKISGICNKNIFNNSVN